MCSYEVRTTLRIGLNYDDSTVRQHLDAVLSPADGTGLRKDGTQQHHRTAEYVGDLPVTILLAKLGAAMEILKAPALDCVRLDALWLAVTTTGARASLDPDEDADDVDGADEDQPGGAEDGAGSEGAADDLMPGEKVRVEFRVSFNAPTNPAAATSLRTGLNSTLAATAIPGLGQRAHLRGRAPMTRAYADLKAAFELLSGGAADASAEPTIDHLWLFIGRDTPLKRQPKASQTVPPPTYSPSAVSRHSGS